MYKYNYTPPFAIFWQVPHNVSWSDVPLRSASSPLAHSWCLTHESSAEDELEK